MSSTAEHRARGPEDEAPVDSEGGDTDLRFQRIEEPTTQEKVRATLAAKLALAGGFVLLELADRTFLVTRWNSSRHCADLAAVAAFARQVGAL